MWQLFGCQCGHQFYSDELMFTRVKCKSFHLEYVLNIPVLLVWYRFPKDDWLLSLGLFPHEQGKWGMPILYITLHHIEKWNAKVLLYVTGMHMELFAIYVQKRSWYFFSKSFVYNLLTLLSLPVSHKLTYLLAKQAQNKTLLSPTHFYK